MLHAPNPAPTQTVRFYPGEGCAPIAAEVMCEGNLPGTLDLRYTINGATGFAVTVPPVELAGNRGWTHIKAVV